MQHAGPYNLAGYSFGSCVAIEMVLELQRTENLAVVNSLHLLDGSHSFVSAYTKMYRGVKSITDEGHGETEALCVFVQQFTPVDYNQVSINHHSHHCHYHHHHCVFKPSCTKCRMAYAILLDLASMSVPSVNGF